jgi:cytosine/adenosine deaminase-related metal-dependent hydrolase
MTADSFTLSEKGCTCLGEDYAPFCDKSISAGAKRLYVPSLDMPDKQIDGLIDYVLSSDARLAVTCSQTLESAGRIDARFARSPVMLLYEFGLLERTAVISGVFLDKDDLALMAQERVPLVVLPSHDAGYGHGVAPICAATERGVRVFVGTGDGAHNPNRNVIYEAAVLGLLVSAQMNRQNAVSARELAKMCLPEPISGSQIAKTEKRIQNVNII